MLTSRNVTKIARCHFDKNDCFKKKNHIICICKNYTFFKQNALLPNTTVSMKIK